MRQIGGEMAAEITQTKISLPPAVLRALQVFAALYLVCFVAELLCRFSLHYGFPYIWPLQPYYPPFSDFTFFAQLRPGFHSGLFFTAAQPFNYPATLAVVFEALFQLPFPLPSYLLLILLGFVLGARLFVRALRQEGLSTSSLFLLISALAVSYPLWFELEQANIEALVLLIITLGLWSFLRNRPYAAAVCFGIATSMKIFPFVFLALLLIRRQYRALAFGCLAALGFSVACLWLETGSVSTSWHGTSGGMEYFRQHYSVTVNGFDHSLFEVEKRIVSGIRYLHAGSGKLPAEEAAAMLRFYLPVVALAGIASFFTRIRRMPVVNQILALTVACIVLPPVSFEYTLMHLYAPCALLVLVAVRSARREGTVPGLAAALLTMAVLLAPETEFIAGAITLEGEIKCLALLTLFYLALRYPFFLGVSSAPEEVVASAPRSFSLQRQSESSLATR
ncbi:MAG: hypothetical protein NVSMB3_02400 [Acidobacteriaceae bacterium]